MMKSSSFSDYLDRIKERCTNSNGKEALRCCIWGLLLSADRHLSRFDLAGRRHERARDLRDSRAEHVEREDMLASLYEAADTVYMVVQMLDPDVLELRSSLDGAGLSGDDAGFVLDVLGRLERIAHEIWERASEHRLHLDFSHAVDEREGVTYSEHCHWRDFGDGSIDESFHTYFAEVQRAVSRRLAQIPRFWRQRRLKQVYVKRPNLAKLLLALLTASFEERRLAKRIERQVTGRMEKPIAADVRRHWPAVHR